MKKKNLLLGIFFLILQILIIITNHGYVSTINLIWFCNHIPLFLALGFFFDKIQLIKGLISAGLIAQIVWAIDIIYFIVTQNFLFGVTDYVLELQGFFLVMALVVHFLSTFVALAFTYKTDINKKSLYYTYAYGGLLIIFTLLFTDPQLNINCLFEMCGFEDYTFNSYTYFFPLIASIVFVIPGYYIQRLLYMISNKKS